MNKTTQQGQINEEDNKLIEEVITEGTAKETKKKSIRKPAKIKCSGCGAYIDREVAYTKGAKHYCETCYQTVQKEADDYKNLIGFICQLFEIDAPPMIILTQIKDYKEKYGYSYRGMKTTLDYFYNIMDNSIDNFQNKKQSVGIIPYVYDEAKKFYMDRDKLNPLFSEEVARQIEENCSYINIDYEDFSEDNNGYCNVGLVDITELIDEIDEEEYERNEKDE